jgi:hypothetical protein
MMHYFYVRGFSLVMIWLCLRGHALCTGTFKRDMCKRYGTGYNSVNGEKQMLTEVLSMYEGVAMCKEDKDTRLKVGIALII